jgi:hypothetical protein
MNCYIGFGLVNEGYGKDTVPTIVVVVPIESPSITLEYVTELSLRRPPY